MAKKEPKESVRIKAELDAYIDYMLQIGKEPTALYVRRKQKSVLDKGAKAMAENAPGATKDSVAAAKMDTYRGYSIVITD